MLMKYNPNLYIDPQQVVCITVESPVVKIRITGQDNPILLHVQAVGKNGDEAASDLADKINDALIQMKEIER